MAPYSPYDGINEHGLAVAFMTDASASELEKCQGIITDNDALELLK